MTRSVALSLGGFICLIFFAVAVHVEPSFSRAAMEANLYGAPFAAAAIVLLVMGAADECNR